MISSHDVIVVGAGPAGIGAALAAARNGARTLLIEDSGMAGGCWTLGLQNHVICMHDHRKLIIHGIALELMQRLAATGEAEEPEEKLRRLPRTWYCAFDPEGLKYTLDQMLLESGVEILYHTRCVDTVCDAGGRVTGVVTESKSGRRSFTARIVADCSGDADAAAFAGAATRKGRDSDGRMQPATTAFMLANVDYDRAAAHLAAHPGFMAECEAKARKLGELDMPISPYPGCRTMIDGVTYHNMTRITGIDGTRAEDLTRAEIEGRRQARLMAAFFRKYIPGFERSALIATGSVGLRETRRLCGVKTLTREDVMSARKFPRWIRRRIEFRRRIPSCGRGFLPDSLRLPDSRTGRRAAGRGAVHLRGPGRPRFGQNDRLLHRSRSGGRDRCRSLRQSGDRAAQSRSAETARSPPRTKRISLNKKTSRYGSIVVPGHWDTVF